MHIQDHLREKFEVSNSNFAHIRHRPIHTGSPQREILGVKFQPFSILMPTAVHGDDVSGVDSHDHDGNCEGKLPVRDRTMAAVASLPMGDALSLKLQCHPPG